MLDQQQIDDVKHILNVSVSVIRQASRIIGDDGDYDTERRLEDIARVIKDIKGQIGKE